MKKMSIKNLNILVKGFFISIIPFVVIRLETFFVKSYSTRFLISSLYEILVVGVIGLILSWVYISFKNRYKEISKKVIKGVIIVYYLLCLIYFVFIIYFQIQAPLIS